MLYQVTSLSHRELMGENHPPGSVPAGLAKLRHGAHTGQARHLRDVQPELALHCGAVEGGSTSTAVR